MHKYWKSAKHKKSYLDNIWYTWLQRSKREQGYTEETDLEIKNGQASVKENKYKQFKRMMIRDYKIEQEHYNRNARLWQCSPLQKHTNWFNVDEFKPQLA